jgi:phosphoglycolate phosphatase-like HAD superfamily hydrolase
MPCCDVFTDYDVIIFDCDGVILDSNTMKIAAMRIALKESEFPNKLITHAINAFKNNFGKSRYFHSQYFVETLWGLSKEKSRQQQELILQYYGDAVEQEYLHVAMADGIQNLLDLLSNKTLYIASGSEEKQLIRIFKQRNLAYYFNAILGSPITKSDNVKHIIKQHKHKKILFIGDAVADHQAAIDNGIDFIFYTPYSNVKEKMLARAQAYHFPVIHSFVD